MGFTETADELVAVGRWIEDESWTLLELRMRLVDVTETLGLAEVCGGVDIVLEVSLGYVKYTAHPVLVGETLDTDVYVLAWEFCWKEGEDSVPFWATDTVVDAKGDEVEILGSIDDELGMIG